jgi:c-di-GMP-related signal transduction protein
MRLLQAVLTTSDVVGACQALAADQYVIALDDFMDEPKWQPLIPCVRFLKVG